MHGYDYKAYFAATTSQRLTIILESENHILGLDNGKGKMRFPGCGCSLVAGICIGDTAR